MLKEFIKKKLPESFVKYLQKRYKRVTMYRTYRYDLKRYSNYSKTNNYNSQIKLEGIIIKEYHVIEKGLTMPNRRIGFGKDKIISLCNNCLLYIDRYCELSTQVRHAISVIKEYYQIHEKFEFEDPFVITKMEELLNLPITQNVNKSTQQSVSNEDYFRNISANFTQFSESRKSIRSYTDKEVSLEKLKNAIRLSLNYPSACNRQTVRLYVYTDKNQINNILEIQGGNRGFGHLTNKLIIITAELGVFEETAERNQAFIDGGIYLMNLLYSLHEQKIGACTLNCSNTPEKDKILQNICGTKESEVFIAMVTCGIPPTQFYVALSPRYNLDDICKIN